MNFWNFWNGFATAHTSNNFPCFQVGVTCDRQFSFYRLGLLAGRGLAHSVLGWSCVRSLVQGRSVIRYQQVVTETARKGSSNLLMIWKRWLFTLLCFEQALLWARSKNSFKKFSVFGFLSLAPFYFVSSVVNFHYQKLKSQREAK